MADLRKGRGRAAVCGDHGERLSFAYDAAGNQLSRSTAGAIDRSISWDGDSRPVAVTTPSGTASFVHGPDGARLKKTTASGTTLYLGDDVERDIAGAWSIYPLPDIRLVNGGLSVLHSDHLASVRRETDAGGTVTRSSTYRPFGA